MVNESPRTQPFDRTGPYVAPTGSGAGMVMSATEGVLGRRFFAYLIDLLIILALMAVLSIIIGVLGILTLGLGWALYAVVVPGTGILYSAITVGGSRQSTIGMRMMGLRVLRLSGGRVDWVSAGVHALLFYLAASTFLLWVLDIIIGVARDDRRMGHDLLVGLMVARTG
jgi:uncharacterized RDD family membrane protein YckC